MSRSVARSSADSFHGFPDARSVSPRCKRRQADRLQTLRRECDTLHRDDIASIIAIGSEMLGPIRVDTNSLKITAALEQFGVPVARKSIVGDSLARSRRRRSATRPTRSDIVITTGGLGPTEDDLTREALAEAFGLEMEVDVSIIETIQSRFAARGWTMPEVNKRQAQCLSRTDHADERARHRAGLSSPGRRQARLGLSRRAARAGVDAGDVPASVARAAQRRPCAAIGAC